MRFDPYCPIVLDIGGRQLCEIPKAQKGVSG